MPDFVILENGHLTLTIDISNIYVTKKVRDILVCYFKAMNRFKIVR